MTSSVIHHSCRKFTNLLLQTRRHRTIKEKVEELGRRSLFGFYLETWTLPVIGHNDCNHKRWSGILLRLERFPQWLSFGKSLLHTVHPSEQVLFSILQMFCCVSVTMISSCTLNALTSIQLNSTQFWSYPCNGPVNSLCTSDSLFQSKTLCPRCQ